MMMMGTHEPTTLTRDVEVIRVPDGETVMLESGAPVVVTQALGGAYTIRTLYGAMFRVDETDVDALGIDPAIFASSEVPLDPDLPLDERVEAVLKTCYDPEIPVNILDLGLIYGRDVSQLPSGAHRVDIQMTLTAPGCGMADILKQDVEIKVGDLEGVEEVVVELVFEPPWNPGLMTEAARLELGMF